MDTSRQQANTPGMISKGRNKVIFNVGRVFERKQKLPQAEAAYRKLASGGDPMGYYRVANLRYNGKDYATAAEFYSKAVAADFGGKTAYKRLAFCLEKTEDPDGAIDVLTRAVDRYPDDDYLRRSLGRLLVRNGDKVGARAHFSRIAKTTTDVDVEKDYLDTFDKRTPAWLVATAYSNLVHRHEDDAEWLYRYACILEDAGRVGDAAHYFDKALIMQDNSWWSYRAGLAWQLNGRNDIASSRYADAISSDEKIGGKKWGIGAFHEKALKWDLAATSFEQDALEASEVWRKAGLYARAGRNYGVCLDYSNSIRCYRSAISLRPLDTKLVWELAGILELDGQYTEAIGWLKQMLDSDSFSHVNTEATRWAIARLAFYLGHETLAYLLLRQVFGFDPALAVAETDTSPEKASSDSMQSSLMGDEVATSIYDLLIAENFSKIDPVATCRDLSGSLFNSSADRRGHVERAFVAEANGNTELALREWRFAELLCGEVEATIADNYSRLLFEAGHKRKACEVLLSTKRFWSAMPEGFATPEAGSYEETLSYYLETRSQRLIEDNVILYEANLGISIDCNPLAICRAIMKKYPGKYVHVWSVNAGVPLPGDLAASSDVITVQKDSRQFVRLLATAKYLVNSSTFPTYFTRRPEQHYLMTWHGTPLKTLCKDIPEPLVHMNMSRNYLQASLVIFPNEHTRKILIDHGDINGLLTANVEISGYPRNDSLVGLTYDKHKQRKVALIAPTWREDSELQSQVDTLIQLKTQLEIAGYDVRIRAHHYVEKAAREIDPTIPFVHRNVSTYDLLPEVDVLVTDFSSIYFDFACTDRPIIFYVPDWDRYSEKRGVYFNQDHLPGAVCTTIDEFTAAIADPAVDMSAREAFRREFAPADDGHASERVAEMLLNSPDLPLEPSPAEGADRGVLLRQSLIPNGMASSFINLVTALSRHGVPTTLLTEGRSVQQDTPRQLTLKALSADTRVIGRVGMQPKTRLAYHAMVTEKRLQSNCSQMQKVIDDAFAFEALRVLPVAGFKAAIEFDGYSDFMARLIFAIGRYSHSRVVYLHNDIYDEICSRMPELRHVVMLMPRFDKAVSVSKGLMEDNRRKLGTAYGINTENFVFARNLILPDRLAEKASMEDVNEELPEIHGTPLFVHVGRMSPEKNHMFLLEVFRRFHDKHPNAQLILLGDGPLRSEVDAKVESLNLRDCVSVPGWVSNPYPIVAAADALLIPSLHEGQPMVILESRSLGTPVLGSDIGSIRAMAEVGAQEILPFDEEIWVEAMERIVESPENYDMNFDNELYVKKALMDFLNTIEPKA